MHLIEWTDLSKCSFMNSVRSPTFPISVAYHYPPYQVENIHHSIEATSWHKTDPGASSQQMGFVHVATFALPRWCAQQFSAFGFFWGDGEVWNWRGGNRNIFKLSIYVAYLYIKQCDIQIFQIYSFVHIHISTGRLYFDIWLYFFISFSLKWIFSYPYN